MWNDTLTLKFHAKIKDSFITHEIMVQIPLCSKMNEIAREYAEVIHRQWNTLEQKASSGRKSLLSVTRSFSYRTGRDIFHHLIYTGHEQIP